MVRAADAPAASRIAGGLLALVGVANLIVGVVATLARQPDVSLLLAVGLAVAGAVTLALARWVFVGHRRATVVALVVFGVLLVPRLVGVAGATGQQLVSLVMLVAIVAALGVAAVTLHRRDVTETG